MFVGSSGPCLPPPPPLPSHHHQHFFLPTPLLASLLPFCTSFTPHTHLTPWSDYTLFALRTIYPTGLPILSVAGDKVGGGGGMSVYIPAFPPSQALPTYLCTTGLRYLFCEGGWGTLLPLRHGFRRGTGSRQHCRGVRYDQGREVELDLGML